MGSRSLNEDEKSFLKSFYDSLGASIDYDNIDIYDEKFRSYQRDDTVMTVPDIVNPLSDRTGIYYPSSSHDYYSADYSAVSDDSSGWRKKHNLIHEVYHVKQSQEMTDVEYSVVVGNDAREGNYNYEAVFASTPFGDLSSEQQAEFIADYYLIVNGKGMYIDYNKPGGTVYFHSQGEYEGVVSTIDFTFSGSDSMQTDRHLNAIQPEGDDTDAEDVDTPVDDVEDKVETAKEQPSPLVIDLDGDGVELTSLNSANAVYWDHNLDGFAEASGWVTGGDGLLAIDLNEDGIINNSGELFGNSAGEQNGFTVLAQYDSNEDGLITAEDADFDKLLVWIDDGDGFSDYDELYGLSDLLITSINLAYSEVNTTISGNSVLQESTVTINGNTRDIADVYFSVSHLNSVYDLSLIHI